MKSTELAPCIVLYENAFRPGNVIDLVEEESRNAWGYVQWERSSTGNPSNSKIDAYRSSLSCELEPLLQGEENIAVDRVRPLCAAVTDVVMALEKSIWHYRNSYNVNVEKNEGYRILKYGAGAEYRGHVDHAPQNQRVMSLVAFFNDVDDGGELEFPVFNVSVKPRAGSAVIFPSNFPYFHFANPAGEASDEVKYSLVTWFQ